MADYCHVAKKPYIPEHIQIKIGNRIKELRIQAGYTSYENFALEKDIDRKQYWRAENGVNLTLKSIVRIANLHKISLEDFFKGL